MLLGGFWLGSAIPDISRNIHLVIGIVVLLSILPAIIEALRIRAKKKAVVARPRLIPRRILLSRHLSLKL